MNLTFTLSEMTLTQIDAAIAMLSAYRATIFPAALGAPVQPTVTHNGGSSEPEATPSSGDPAGDQTPTAAKEDAPSDAAVAADDKPKRGRPRKSAEPEQAAQEPSNGAASSPAAEPQQAAPDTSIDALRGALQRFTAANGMPAGIDLLKSFECARISELAEKPVNDKLAFLAKCPKEAA